MITTTFRLAKEAEACESRYRQFARHVGGIKKYGRDTPVPLTEVVDVLGIEDALWCLCCTQNPEEAEKVSHLLAADFAEHVLPIFEKSYPNDNRPRKAIEAARLFADGKIGDAARAAARAAARDAAKAAARAAAWDAARDAAGAAARDAAGAAAWDAAGDAARDAAWAAEREWQLKRFKEVISP